MKKVAVLSDVHGNVTALEAAIADAQAAGADEYWFLGDLFMPGPGTHDIVRCCVILMLRSDYVVIGMISYLQPWNVRLTITSQRVFTRHAWQLT